MVNEIRTALLPVFFVLALGYFAGTRGMVDNKNVADLNHFVMAFAIPASIFVSVSSKSRTAITSHATFIAVITISTVVVYAITLWLRLRVFKRGKSDAAIQALTVSFPNYASIGLPLVSAVVGDAGVVAVAICIALGSMTVTPVTLSILESDKLGPDAPGSALSRFLATLGRSLRRPIFLAPSVAIVLVMCGVRVPGLVESTITPLGNASAGAALFLTGLMLSAQKATLDASAAYGIVMKNVLMPLFVWGLCLLFGLNTATTVEAVLLTAIPSGFFGLVFGANFAVKPRDSGATLLLSTVAGIGSLSVVIALLPSVS